MINIKQFLSQFSKKEKEIKKPVRQKKKILEYRQVKRIVVTIVSLFLVFFLATAIRVFTATHTIAELNKQVTQLTEQVNNAKTAKIDERAFSSFIYEFVSKFINVGGTSEKLKEREKALSGYYAKGVTQSDYKQAITREHKSGAWIGLRLDEQPYKAIFQVKYSIHEPVEKERTLENGQKEKYVETEKKEVTNYIEIPFIAEKNQFKIVAEPYFISKPSVLISDYKVTSLLSLGRKVDDNQLTKDLDNFLNSFFPKYATGKTDDLKYVMAEPIGLNDTFTYESLKSDYYVTDDNRVYLALLTVKFVDKNTKFSHQEKMKLMIKQDNDKFMVLSLEHVN